MNTRTLIQIVGGNTPVQVKQAMEEEAVQGGDSPLPGVDDEEVPDSPLPEASQARGGEPGDEAMQPGGLADEDECAARAGPAGEGAGEGAGLVAAEDTSAPSAASPAADAPALGKRRDEAAAPPASGPEAVQKRSRLGDAPPGPPAYEGLVLTAADGTKVCAPRKVAAPKVGRRLRDSCTLSAACSNLPSACSQCWALHVADCGAGARRRTIAETGYLQAGSQGGTAPRKTRGAGCS